MRKSGRAGDANGGVVKGDEATIGSKELDATTVLEAPPHLDGILGGRARIVRR